MFGFNNKIIVDKDKIEEIVSRGVENIYPSADFLKSKLLSGQRISIYLGIDPTGPTLHLGHVIPLIKLGALQKLGHQIILLMGDFTAMIGDPTDKKATRKKLTKTEVLNNLKEYKKQASKFIDFSGANKALLKYNSEWLGQMKFEDVLELASLMTVEQMLKRDMFFRRTEEGKPIYIHEFLYPLMQGYDSVAMDVDGEIGGNDQTFNMLTGRDLMKTLKNKEKFVIASKLLVDPNGNKMGKTEGNMVALNQSPEDMYGRVMSWNDGLILNGLEMVAKDINLDELNKIKNEFNQTNVDYKKYKMLLAREIVKMCHSKEEALKAEESFVKTFSNKEFLTDAQTIEAQKNEKLMDVLVQHNFLASKTEFRRLVEQGAVSDYPDQKITDPNELVGENIRKLRIGKKTFLIIKPK